MFRYAAAKWALAIAPTPETPCDPIQQKQPTTTSVFLMNSERRLPLLNERMSELI
jgi:hypothetical protein